MSKNTLGNETSPYLLQHADNPVHWRPWGPEALSDAKAQNKPVLLICAVGGRSLALGQLMSKNGWNEVYNLKGGISAWKEAKLPVQY